MSPLANPRLLHILSLSSKSLADNFEFGLLFISEKKKYFVSALQRSGEKRQELAISEKELSLLQKISRCVEPLFIALGLFVAGCALASGALLFGSLLMGAALWQLGYATVRAFDCEEDMVQALAPQKSEATRRAIRRSLFITDITTRLILSFGSGYGAFSITQGAVSIFSIATLSLQALSGTSQIATSVKKSQAANLETESKEQEATLGLEKRKLAEAEEAVKASGNRLDSNATMIGKIIQSDHEATEFPNE